MLHFEIIKAPFIGKGRRFILAISHTGNVEICEISASVLGLVRFKNENC